MRTCVALMILDVLDAKRILSSDLERESRSSRRLSEKGHQVRSRSQNKSNKATKDDKKKAKKSYHGSVSDDTNEDEDSESSDYEPSSGEESVCEEVAFKPTVEVITHATNVHPREDLFWTTWREGAESALNDTAYLEWNAVGYNATAATEALNKACSSSDAIVVTVPYASGTEDYEKMDDAINRCIFDHRKPVFTANTDTYHNNDVYAYFGSSNYDMGVKCALAVLFPDDIDIISGRKALPDKSNHSKDIRIYWDSVSKKDEGLRQRFEGLKTTFESFDKDVVKYLPSGRPSCPCVSQYKEGGPKNDEELRLTIDGEVYQYPPRYGLETCSRHDKNMIPSCSLADPPSFCDKTWCYVDPEKCTSVESSTEGEYVWADYPNQMYPYSYETCGSKNLYTNFIDGANNDDYVSDGGTFLTGENVTSIVLSSNWAPDFEIGNQTDNLFICGEETYSMPHVAQFGQSPFLQGLSSVGAAAAAAKSIEKKTEWRAFMGNSAASSSSTAYHPRGFANFAICLQNEDTRQMVGGAGVQCWDNDKPNVDQQIGQPGTTRMTDGCYNVFYDANRSWDLAWSNAQRPDIYCILTYNDKAYRMKHEVVNANSNFWTHIFTEKINQKCPIFTADPTNDLKLQEVMLEWTKECGYYEQQGCNYPVIPANVVHPGEGPGDLEFEPYIVQFDIGIHPKLEVLVGNEHKNYQHEDKRERLTKDKGKKIEGEKCLEIIVKGGSDATGGCAGKCGGGCAGAGYAKDCMKHDVVSIFPYVYCHFSNIKVNWFSLFP